MKTILIIDDEPQTRTMLKVMLENEGFGVTLASDGNEGIERFRQMPTDLILTDIVMPEKEGVETIVELRKIYPATPIIAMSGGGSIASYDYLDHARLLGANDTLRKPFTRQKLLDTISKCFPS